MPKESWTLAELVRHQREFFSRGETRHISFRMAALRRLDAGLRRYEHRLFQALKQDLNKHEFEAFVGEVGMIYEEIKFTLKRLPAWAAPKRVTTPLSLWPSRSRLYSEPLGSVLIIAPWNYPLNLALIPLLGAIAAGNTVILKTSELAPACSRIMKTLIDEIFDPAYCAVVEGGVEETQQLLTERFDHIFFTGSTLVGKVIMRAAAEHLTPVTLELGGKSPCIVDSSAPLDITAKRIVWGKFFNAGQTCTAPDYILVDKAIKEPLLARIKFHIGSFYGSNPAQSPDFARIINRRHFDRLAKLLHEGTIVSGGQMDVTQLYLAPTVIDRTEASHKIMEEEIFGPILPVLEYQKFEDAVAFVEARPKPLACYLFSDSPQHQQRFVNRLSFGGGCINNVLLHFANPHLPFGGVGDSGMGSYHGKRSFEIFSHRKPILKTPFRFDLPLRFPAYKQKLKLARHFIG